MVKTTRVACIPGLKTRGFPLSERLCKQGTVVFVYKQGKGYEVEFFTSDGQTKAVATLMASQVRSLEWYPN